MITDSFLKATPSDKLRASANMSAWELFWNLSNSLTALWRVLTPPTVQLWALKHLFAFEVLHWVVFACFDWYPVGIFCYLNFWESPKKCLELKENTSAENVFFPWTFRLMKPCGWMVKCFRRFLVSMLRLNIKTKWYKKGVEVGVTNRQVEEWIQVQVYRQKDQNQ